MAKYRLSYLNVGGTYTSLNLEKLICLEGLKITDIEIIDRFTTNFNNEKELLDFLKKNEIISEDINKLYITIDKKEQGNVINKKIYNGEKIFFKEDINLLSLSFIYKWLLYNVDNKNYIYSVATNYIEKYKNAYNRVDGSSYILSLFNNLRIMSSTGVDINELNEFNDIIDKFIEFEFYKTKIVNGKRVKKKDKVGCYIKNYRNIHDFVNLVKTLDKDIEIFKESEFKAIDIFDNKKELEKKEYTNNYYDEIELEEFLEECDFINANKHFKADEFEPYKDGNDWVTSVDKEAALLDIQTYVKKMNEK